RLVRPRVADYTISYPTPRRGCRGAPPTRPVCRARCRASLPNAFPPGSGLPTEIAVVHHEAHMTRLLMTCLLTAAWLSARRAADLEYNRDVRPILAENCFACHRPDSASRKAGLRLDQRDDPHQTRPTP